jgi:predicted methyltransferase
MRGFHLSIALLACVFIGLPGMPVSAASQGTDIAKAVAGSWRTPAAVARDSARHPVEELSFFGISPTMTVVEIWPSGGYWTEVLAPYLHDRGTYYAAGLPRALGDRAVKAEETFRAKLDANKSVYGNVRLTELGKGAADIAPPGSADLILTFRNLHNWMGGGWGDEAMAAFYKALKPGGILGIEDHRGATDHPQDPQAKSGYVRQDYAIELARKAGFEFVGASEINANPKDTKDYPQGVWTLPPTLTLGDVDRAKYAAIGEADNFVLKFRKPLK